MVYVQMQPHYAAMQAAEGRIRCSRCATLLIYPLGAPAICCAACGANTPIRPQGGEPSKMQHLRVVKMSYFAHLARAWKLGLTSAWASVVFFVHGIYPDVLENTGSTLVANMYIETRH